MDARLPLAWPEVPPAHGGVVLRQFRSEDAHLATELAEDPYIPLISSIPSPCPQDEAVEWILRQNGRFTSGAGYSFAVADAQTDRALGQIGLWLTYLPEGRATAGYLVAPSNRGQGRAADALAALAAFGWTIPELHRLELYIEPWNKASFRTAEAAGFSCEGLLRSYQVIGGERRDMLLYAAVRQPARTASQTADRL
jgi:ribosomal-protein-alanine N-acetyltransferase